MGHGAEGAVEGRCVVKRANGKPAKPNRQTIEAALEQVSHDLQDLYDEHVDDVDLRLAADLVRALAREIGVAPHRYDPARDICGETQADHVARLVAALEPLVPGWQGHARWWLPVAERVRLIDRHEERLGPGAKTWPRAQADAEVQS
jgi:hypothetical protein